MLVTSRERLRVDGEHEYPVPALARADAVELLRDARAGRRSDFEPDEHVDELCARLDDLPLALELAAARVRRCCRRSSCSSGSASGSTSCAAAATPTPRQRTLRATIEWSTTCSTPEEQQLFAASLASSAAAATLEAAERVAARTSTLLESLVDKSLVRRWEPDRFWMLETIREFAAERLDAAERGRADAGSLLEHFLELAEERISTTEAARRRSGRSSSAGAGERGAALAWALDAGEISSDCELLWLLEIFCRPATRSAAAAGSRRSSSAWTDASPAFCTLVQSRSRLGDLRHVAAGATSPSATTSARGSSSPRPATTKRWRTSSTASRCRRSSKVTSRGRARSARRRSSAIEGAGHRRDEAVALNVLGNVALEQGDRTTASQADVRERGARAARSASTGGAA